MGLVEREPLPLYHCHSMGSEHKTNDCTESYAEYSELRLAEIHLDSGSGELFQSAYFFRMFKEVLEIKEETYKCVDSCTDPQLHFYSGQ